ncbi:MAG: DUF5677 domain-containing protein [Alphaproteobacteria bacterium]
MKILHEALHSAIENIPQSLIADLLREKLIAQGVYLSQRQCEKLARQVINEKLDSLDLPRWRFWQYRRFRKPKKLQIEFTSEDAQKITAALDEFSDKRLPDLIQEIVAEHSQNILGMLQKRWKLEFKQQVDDESKFRLNLQIRWGLPIEQLRMLRTIALEFGSDVNRDMRRIAMDEKHLIDVLTRLHARACQVTSEVECLLSGGFSDGAMARWRTLHEVAVVARFISKHGAECAERYVDHQFVESRKAARNYERCQARLGYEPISESELKETERQYQFVLGKYGSQFSEQYGWARPYLSISEKAHVKFSDIEEAADLDHLRAHYQMASHNVHANAKGVFFKLGLIAESNVLLAGPSNAGLADPGHASALSLIQASSALMTIDPTLDNVVLVKIMMKLADEIGDNFLAASKKLDQDAVLGLTMTKELRPN